MTLDRMPTVSDEACGDRRMPIAVARENALRAIADGRGHTTRDKES